MMKIFRQCLCLLLCLLFLPVCGLAEDAEVSIADNPDLTDEEKALWEEWANAPADEETPAETDVDAEMLAELESALVENDTVDEEINVDDLELNTALPDNVVNILLLGVDNRSVDLKSGLSDAVIICSLNLDDGSIKLSSITRDTAVVIPGYKSKKRINCAFKFGSKDGSIAHGGFLAMKTVNRNFEMNIQRYVVVNIHGLASIIDALGGVDLEMTKREAARINYELKKEPMDKVKREKVKSQDGVQHLDGMQAVTFARIRGIDDDFHRTERQRKLLSTLMSAVMKDMSIDKLVKLIEVALPFGATNLTAGDLLMYGGAVLSGKVMSNVQSGEAALEQFRMPMDGTFKYANDNGATLTAFRSEDRKADNIDALQEFIYGQTY